jgi:drug/metabolite transporter (DMT)-like permease
LVDQKILGIAFGVVAGAIWAVEAILGKLLFESLTFLQVAASEAFFATITTLGYMLLRSEKVSLTRRNLGKLILVGVLGTVFAPSLFFLGLTQTYAVNATLIAHLQPLFITFLSMYFLKERVKKRDALAGSLIILAAILITGRTMENLLKLNLGNYGDLLVFCATAGWAIVAIPGKQLSHEMNSLTIVSFRFLIASSIFFPVLVSLNQLVINSINQIILGVLVGLGYICYYEGLKRLSASHVALTELASPFFAAILAWFFLGELISPLQIAGAGLLFSGLYLLTKQPSTS